MVNENMPELPLKIEKATITDWLYAVEVVVEYWDESKDLSNFCLVNFLNTLSARLEIAADEFQKQDPDPIDQRHPVHLTPKCEYGMILRGVEKCTAFITCLVEDFIKDESTIVDCDGCNVSVAEAACRFLLVAYTIIETFSSETVMELSDLLYGYAMDKEDPISTYAIGILSKQSDQMCLSSKCDKSNENKVMVRSLLRRLWKLVNPESNSQQKLLKKPESSTSTSDGGCSKDTAIIDTPSEIPCIKDDKTKSTKSMGVPPTNSSAKKGRKRAAPQPDETKTRMKLRRSQPDVRNAYVNRLSSSASTFEISMPSINDMPEANYSSSSWKEMRPIVVGLRFSLKPPLSSKVQQLYLLDWLSPLAEYQDVLSIFIEQNALDLVLWYLKRSATNNGLITYAAMRLLSGLLCHHKITIVFIEKKGIEKLLRVPRPSIGATGGALILYYLSYHKEAMALMAGLGNKIIQEMINYGVWLLESSHDSGRCHSALFFLYAFSYQTVMKVFDSRNGIRYLINMIGTLPIMNPDPEASDQRTEEMSNFSCRQVTKTACTTLKKYFETHLKMEFGAATALASGKNEWPFDSTKPVEIDGRTELLAYLDFLRFSEKRQGKFEIAEKSIRAFIKFDGIRLLLKVIMLAKTWSCSNRSDIIRSALDCLAIVTLSSAAWPLLLQPVLTGDLPNEKETGLWLMLSLVESNKEDSRADVQKSALAIIINCVCDPRLMKYRNGIDPSSTPPLDAVPTSLNDSLDDSTATKNKVPMEDLKLAWKIVKYQNGIQILLDVMTQAHSAVDADDFRLLACQALCGLSCCDSIRQIMSKLPFFNSGQIQALVQKPVLQNNQTIAQHARFRTFIRMLVERLSGKLYSKLNMDLESQRKEHIVTQTPIRFNNHELLQVIHKHLKWSGLDKTAALLAKEALLPIQHSSQLTDGSSSETPSSSQTCESGGDTPNRNRISFTRGSKAQGKLPLLEKAAIGKKSNKMESPSASGSGKAATFKIPRKGAFLLSSNGTISTRKRHDESSDDSDRKTPPPAREEVTLNHIITDYLRTQHASCSDPVVTVPELSLFRPHRCPTPCYRTEAPRNASRRNFHRQINPRHGGQFGQQYDRQLIYGKMKPCMTLHSGDNDTSATWRSEDSSYTACTFSSDDMSMILGNWQGDIIVRSIQGDEDHVILKAMDFGAYGLECSRDGSTLLGFGNNGYTSYCQLFNMEPLGSESVHSKWILEGPTHMEFAKKVQNKVVGTKNLKAKIYDLKTGQMTQVLTNENLTSHYTDNRATFSYDDWLVLNDGLLWDLRAAQKPIHKFDKFNQDISGIFHPQNLEIIINTEVWDMRNFHLLHTVPALDKRHLRFNNDGSVAYAADLILRSPTYMERRDISTTLAVIDGYNYTTLNMIDTRHDITDFACDRRDYYVATIENRHDHDPETRRVCRLYELGRSKDKDDDDEEEEDEDGENPLDDEDEEEEDDFDYDDNDDTEDSDTSNTSNRYVMHDSSGLDSDEIDEDDAGSFQDSDFSGEWSPATMDDSDGDARMTEAARMHVMNEDY